VGGGYPTLRDKLIQPREAALNQTTFLTKGTGTVRQSDGEHKTQKHAEVQSIINKDSQVAPTRMPLGVRFAVNTYNMEGCFVESMKNARWSMSLQEAGDELESILEFQVQIKRRNQQEYEDKRQGGQNCTDEKLATNLMKDDRQPVLLLPARWWPDMLPEFENEGWWQRPQTLVKCRHFHCGFVENPCLRSNKCHGCGKQMQTKGKRLHDIVFTNADQQYAGILDDPQGGDTTMLMQQVREVMTVNQEMEDESSCIELTSEQMGFTLWSEFANENHSEARSSKQCNDQRTDQPAFFLAPIITGFIRNRCAGNTRFGMEQRQ